MNITILSVDIKTVPTAKGSYQTAEIAYKNNTFQGKVEGKKVMSFGATAATFKVLAEAQPGSSFDVTVVKNDKGYNDWTALTPAGVNTAAPAASKAVPAGATASPRSTYETPEERAAKQVYIVRQSSLANAISTLSVGAKTPPKLDDVLATAQAYTDFVFGAKSETKPSAGASGFEDIPDFDIPTVG